jgi:hypothetical protein
LTIPIGYTGLALSQQYYSSGGGVVTNTQTSSVALNLNTVAMNGFGTVLGGVTLRPGLDSVPVTIATSNPAVAAVPTSPILNSLTGSSPVTLKPLAPGQTDLTVVPPPGYLAAPPGSGRTMHVTVNGPAFTIADLALGRDLQLPVQMTVANGNGAIPADVDVTLTSGDATRLVLSAASGTPGAGSLTIHFARGDQPQRTVWVQALDQSGPVPITISAAGYATSTTTATLYPTTFFTNVSQLSTTVQGSPQTVPFLPGPAMPQRPNLLGNFLFRPGASPAIAASATPAGIVDVSPASTTWPAGAGELDLAVRGLGAGTASLTLTVPALYVAPTPISVTVTGSTLTVSPPSLTVGYNLQDIFSVSVGQPGANLTVTSSNPSLMLVSGSPSAPGQASVTIPSTTSQNVTVYVQALAAAGNATLTFSAPGYGNATAPVQLMGSAVELTAASYTGTLTPLSAPLAFQAKLVAYSPTYNPGYTTATLRPGAAPLTVPVTFSDPKVATATPAQVTFGAGTASQNFSVQPVAPGSTLLSLGVPAGFSDPVALRQQLLTVIAARASFTLPLTVGKDLSRINGITLAGAVGSSLTLTVTSADPSRLLLSTGSNSAGAASITVTVPGGSSNSGSLNLIGLASSGSVGVTVSAPGLTTTTNTVTLEPAGVVFSTPTASTTVNTRVFAQVSVFALNPDTLAPDASLPLRPGLAPIPVSIASSNPASVNASSVALNAGFASTQVSFTPAAPGTAIMTLQQPPGFTTPSSGSTLTITVQ